MKKFTYPFYLIWRHNVVFFNEIHLRKARNAEGTKLSVWRSTQRSMNSVSTLPHKLQLEGFMHGLSSAHPDCEELLAAWCKAAGVQNTSGSPGSTLDPALVSRAPKWGHTLLAAQCFPHLPFTLEPYHASEAAVTLRPSPAQLLHPTVTAF